MSPAQGSSSALSDRHTCDCGKSFARKEHLTRHQATHDQPAHVCNVCQRRFSRRELLRRHSLLHDPKRTRVVISCDACRTNKTKCSGGTPCSLCTRRGIKCTFRTSRGRSKGPAIGNRLATVDSSVHGDSNDEESALPETSRLETFPPDNPLHTDRAPSSHGWLQDLSIIPSEPVAATDFQPLSPGMGAIYELLLAEKSSLEAANQGSEELQDWLSQCLATYFKAFHLRWPLLNAPSFDATSAPLLLAASVCVIGTWLCDNAERDEKLHALRVHDLLLQYVLRDLIGTKAISEGQAWPIEFLQAVLLNLVFSLYRTNGSTLSETKLLRSVFITILRENGMFNAQTLANHLQTYFTGIYAPYTISMREQFRRLLALTYQFDAYFALTSQEPPMLHRQEVGVDLTATFALWNAHGLDIFAKRLLEEPMDRPGFQISVMTNSPDSFTSSQLLVEDVLLGLCGTLQGIWVFIQFIPPKNIDDHSTSVQRVRLVEALDGWKNELDKIKRLIETGSITSDAAKHLLLAYRGEDESVMATLKRITTLLQDGMVLYYYLKLYHYAGLGTNEVVRSVKQTEEPSMDFQQSTKDEREASICALQMLKFVDSIRTSSESIDPLIRHALVMGFNVITRMLVSYKKCECPADRGHHTREVDLRQWVQTGGPLSMGGTRFCVCKLAVWTRRFEEAIQSHSVMIEASEIAPDS